MVSTARIVILCTTALLVCGCSTMRPVERTARMEDGTRVAYVDVRGTGPRDEAIILVHGWSCDHEVWAEQIRPLAERCRVLAVDLPGHGGSDKPAVEYTMAYFAIALAEVMEDAGVNCAVLVGHSNGTPVVREFYRMYPRRTEGLVVVEGALRNLFPDEASSARVLDQMSGTQGDAFIEDLIDQSLPRDAIDGMTRARLRAMMLATPAHVQLSSFRGSVDPGIWTEDPIEVPTLVVLADAPFWNQEYEAYVRRLVSDVEYHKIPGASHFLMVDHAETFNQLLLAWLDRQRVVEGG